MASIDDILAHIGPWHYWTMAFVFLRGFPTAYHVMGPTFAAPKLDFFCAKPESLGNWTTQQWRTHGVPYVHGRRGTHDQCLMYKVEEMNGTFRVSNHEVQHCSNWEYDHSGYTHTLTDQFNLVCDRVWLRAASQSFFMAGLMVGSFVFAHLSDWYGRKRVMVFMMPIPLIAGCVAAFSTTFLIYNIARVIIAIGMGGLYNCSSTLMMECLAMKHRAIAIFLLSGGWTCGQLSLVGLAWFLRDWFYLQIAVSVAIVVNIILWFFISESPRWLLTNGKFEEGRSVLRQAMKGEKLREYLVDDVVGKYQQDYRKETKNKKPSFIKLFSSSFLRRTSFIVMAMGILEVLVYYNLTYSSVLLGQNPFLSFALMAGMEFPSCIAAVLLIRYVRRRLSYLVMFAMGSVFSTAVIFIPEDLWWCQLGCAALAKFSTGTAGAVFIVQLQEIYPTQVRTLAMGLYATTSRVGAMTAPFTKELGVLFGTWVPRAVDSSACVLLLLLGTRLPETFNMEFVDTLQEVDLRSRGKSQPASSETEPLCDKVIAGV